jgi:translation initiation factor 2-alpha kinase 4
VAKGWARYDEKVDLFSLGVVAFELWHPFATGMERAARLRELQERGALPPAWEAQHPQARAACLHAWSPGLHELRPAVQHASHLLLAMRHTTTCCDPRAPTAANLAAGTVRAPYTGAGPRR